MMVTMEKRIGKVTVIPFSFKGFKLFFIIQELEFLCIFKTSLIFHLL